MAKYRYIGDYTILLDEILGAQRPLTLSHGTLGDPSRYPQNRKYLVISRQRRTFNIFCCIHCVRNELLTQSGDLTGHIEILDSCCGVCFQI